MLFTAVGVLCRQQLAASVAADADRGAFFSQTEPVQHDAMGRFFARTLFAPELSGCVTGENPDQKAPVRAASLPGYGICAKHFVPGPVSKPAVGLPSRSVDYYVFSLGKILI